MICPKCRRKLDDDAIFCDKCGHAAVTDEDFGKQPIDDNGRGRRKRIVILVVSVFCLCLAAAVTAVSFISVKNRSSDLPQKTEEAAVSEEEDDTKQTEDREGNVEDTGKTEEEEETEETEGTLMVCVPYDEMHLRSKPGSDPKTDIATMTAGEEVLWDGISRTVNGNDFYHVICREDGLEGYAMADYLVPVYYEYDDDLLDIVETDNEHYTYEMMEEDIEKLCKKYGDILTCKTVGKSADGRNMYCLCLGNPNAGHRIFVQASIHAREYMNTQLVMKLTEYYCANHDTGLINDKTYADLFDNVCICIVPMANPDGVTLVQFGPDSINDPDLRNISKTCYEIDKYFLTEATDELNDRFWVDHYKDVIFDMTLYDGEMIGFDEYLKQWKSNANGVDLNDNFDANWEYLDLKDYASFANSKGDRATSEPETAVLTELATADDYDMYISYHSKGELIYYDTNGNDPEVSGRSFALAELAGGQIKHRLISNKVADNVTQGGFSDWVQLKLKKPAITIESGRHRCPLDIREFRPMWLRHRELWAVLMNDIVTNNGQLSK